MNNTEVQNPRHKLMISVYAYHMCLVLFLPVQSLLTCFRSFLTCFADFVSNNFSLDTKAFLRFIAFSGSPTAVHRPLHALRYYTWAYLSELLVKDSHKRLSSTEKPQYRMLKSLDHTLLLCTCYGEIYRNIACEENG